MTDRRPRLDPATARIRNALRAEVRSADAAPLIVAVSGGADSMALTAAAAFLHRRGEARFLACTVDHGLQPGSAEVAARVVERVEVLGLPIARVTAAVDPDHPGGLEAAARRGRYAALARFAADVTTSAAAAGTASAADAARSATHDTLPAPPQILTGHTRDDQAETVLLGLLRGSGARSLSGMAPRTRLDTEHGPIEVVRPLLGVTRDETRASCAAQDLALWHDTMNDDTRFARVRARQALETLSTALGQDARVGLARTADLLREDADHLDAEAAAAWAGPLAAERDSSDEATTAAAAPASLAVGDLAALSPAVAGRVLRTWLLARGVSAGELTADHVRAAREVAAASGALKREVSVPGGGAVRRVRDRVVHVEPGCEDQGRP